MYSNRVTLVGFLGKDAEVRNTRNNASFTILSLATQRSWKNRESGEYCPETTWHRCIVFGKLGEYASTFSKGAHLQIEGEIRTREYAPSSSTDGGAKKSITEVRVQSVVKLDRPKKADSGEAEGGAAEAAFPLSSAGQEEEMTTKQPSPSYVRVGPPRQ